MIKKILFLILLTILGLSGFCDNWREHDGSRIQTTVGYGASGVQYICEWIQNSDYDGVSINVQSLKPLCIGKYRASCLLLGDYVFSATMYDGYGENAVLVRVRGRKLKELLNGDACDAVIMVAGYHIKTAINAKIGEFKE